VDTRNGRARTPFSGLGQASLLSGLSRTGLRSGLIALAACALLQADVWAQNHRTGGRAGAGGGTLVDAPEINPKLAIGVCVLLVGGVLVLTARLRRRAKVN